MITSDKDMCENVPEMTIEASAEPPVTEFVGQLFFRLWRAAHVRAADVLGTVGLTPALFGLLNVIGARQGAIQQELGAAMGVDRSTMVSLIDELEAAGLAKRRPSVTDRRAREIVITPKGRRVLNRARQLVTDTEDEVLASLTGDERTDLVGLLRRALEAAPAQPLWSSQEGD
jgi:MarR family transcriptional regulator for hemolysin